MSEKQEARGSRSRSSSGSAPAQSSRSSCSRGRGGFRSKELNTIPMGLKQTQLKAAPNAPGKPVDVIANFIRIEPMKERAVYQYRVEFEPQVESVRLRKHLFSRATETIFQKNYVYDGASDARSGTLTPSEEVRFEVDNPAEPNSMHTVVLKRVGQIAWGTYEMLRLYNLNMKSFLRKLGFFPLGQKNAWVNPNTSFQVGSSGMSLVRGFGTSANAHENDGLLMNLEPVHKLIQNFDLWKYMEQLQGGRPMNTVQKIMEEALLGKLVLTTYNNIVYRIEGINFQMNPTSTFFERRSNTNISYTQYFQQKHNVTIQNQSQPLLLVVQNNNRSGSRDDGEEAKDIYVVPELCVIAGLTNAQRNDNRLKFELIKATQVSPTERVTQLKAFLSSLHNNKEIEAALNRWGYSFEKEPISVKARLLPLERVGVGKTANLPGDKWAPVKPDSSFEHLITQEQLAKPAKITKMSVIMTQQDRRNESQIVGLLNRAFKNLGLEVGRSNVISEYIDSDRAQSYTNALRSLGRDVNIALVIMPRQNKQVYDAIKQLASGEMGLLTQVITTRLMTDEKKNNGAAVKIGIQVAAKIGAEPWFVQIPLKTSMVCGFDVWHDSANRGRSFGAFIASMNSRFSSWFSKADSHANLQELSTNLAANLEEALAKYKAKNGAHPEILFLYRDGVGDGQLEHVYNSELKQVKSALEKCKSDISLTFIVVNKRVGARFYLKTDRSYDNPQSGTVIDSVVTRKERFDFYLISASTRQGTISPTYYNIIYDESPLTAANHQAMAHKFSLMYYNWAGAVRVPAPVQYAHKLALLCGEHMHREPSALLDDKLHFL